METNIIHYESCITGLLKLDDNSIDHFYADPPFGINFNKVGSMYNRKNKNVVKGYTEPTIPYPDFSNKWIKQVYRVLKGNGSGWI